MLFSNGCCVVVVVVYFCWVELAECLAFVLTRFVLNLYSCFVSSQLSSLSISNFLTAIKNKTW